jgi:hypothetical protein
MADEVVNDLNAQLFSVQFTAERHYLPKFELAKNALPIVAVAPRDLAGEVSTRDREELQIGIDIGVLARVPDATPASCDRFMVLVMELRDRYAHYRTIGGRGVSIEPALEPLYDREWLETKNQFAAVLQLTLQTSRMKPWPTQ